MPRPTYCLVLLMLVGCEINPDEWPHFPPRDATPSKLGGDVLDNLENGGSAAPKNEVQFQATPAGCQTSVDLPGQSYIHGVSISIPPGALINAETVTFSAIRKRVEIKAGTPLGIVYTLSTNGQSAFEEPVAIRIPLSPKRQDHFVMAYQIDEIGKLHLMNAEEDSAESIVVSTWKVLSFTLVLVDSL